MFDEDISVDTPSEPHACNPSSLIIPPSFSSTRHKRNPYKHLTIIKSINKGKFPIYLTHCKDKRENFVMKLFISKELDGNKSFRNEVQFSYLSHPNVIKTVYSEEDRTIRYKKTFTKASLILTELAPYGDFIDLLLNHFHHFNEKLIRTYFRQLIEGLEYLHNNGIAHLDIKLENLLLDKNFTLRITDFDLSVPTKETIIESEGTKCYRAPELVRKSCQNGQAADIYSCGVILFVLKCGKSFPHTEDTPFEGIDFFNLLNYNNDKFWRKHCEVQQREPSEFSEEFKALFNGMTMLKSCKRFSIQEIKASKWYNGAVYNNDELKNYMGSFMKTKEMIC